MASNWRITGQRQTTVSNGQTYVPAMIVSFVTGNGNYGNITVDAAHYTLDKVQAAVGLAAGQIDEIGGLASGPEPTSGALGIS